MTKAYSVCLLSALITAGIVFIGTSKYGAGLSPDGIAYLAAGRSIVMEGRLTDYDSATFAAWPPLYPTVLSFLGFLTGDIELSARLFNVVLTGLTSWVVSLLIFRSSAWVPISVCGAVVNATSFPLLKNGVMVWTEPLFLFLVALACLIAEQFSRVGNQRAVYLMGIVCALASLTRYLGIALVLTAVMFLLAQNGTYIQKCRQIGILVLFSITPLVLWLARNVALTGHLTGPRESSAAELSDLLTRVVVLGTSVFIPPTLPGGTAQGLQIFIGSMLLVSIATVVWKRFGVEGQVLHRFPKIMGELHASPSVVFCALFIVSYVVVVSGGILSVGLEPLSIRYLSPLIPCGWILIVWMISAMRGFISAISTLILGCIALAGLQSALELTRIWSEDGAGDYSVSSWMDSSVLAWIRAHPTNEASFSNSSDFVYAVTGQKMLRLPKRGEVVSWSKSAPQESLLIFFARSFRRYLASRDEFLGVCNLVPIAEFPDGGIYTCHLK